MSSVELPMACISLPPGSGLLPDPGLVSPRTLGAGRSQHTVASTCVGACFFTGFSMP